MAGTETQRDMARADTSAGGASRSRSGQISPGEFAALFEQSFRVLWYIALGLIHDRNLAEDVVQEAAIIALGKLDHFQRGTNFVAWMGQTVRYAALNLARRNRRHTSASTDPALIDADPSQPPRGERGKADPLRLAADFSLPGGQDAFDDRLLRALDGISDTARACLLLRTIEGMEYREIARTLDIAEGTAMSHVHRARTALRDRLADSAGATSRPGGREGS
ncbi:MAG: RNA polymerase sigma factor [Phycisphaerales bacterium]|nr:RNA polymerase sigma factor [Phycisphaerales bacterium]